MFLSHLRKAGLLLAAFLLLVRSQGSIQAADPANGGPFGIRVAINTNGFSFPQPLVAEATARGGAFIASASITNGSRTAATFSFPQGLAEGERILFKVYNSDGDEVWRSDAAPASEAVSETLRSGRSWKRTVRVPLVLNGLSLPIGTYSLEAGLANGDPVLASTIFEVVSRPPGRFAPVNGIVLSSPFDGEFTYSHSYVAGALIGAFRLPEGLGSVYHWLSSPNVVSTGSDGQFSTVAAVGRYKITATLQAGTPVLRDTLIGGFPVYIGLPAFSSGSVTVNVSEGKVCRPVIMLGGAAEKQRIHGVGAVTISRDVANPAAVTITATGVVNTGGWTGPMLVSQEVTPEGILLLDYMARAPMDGATQAFETVNVTAKMPLLPGMKGVRVRSLTNSVTAMLAE